VGYTEWGVLADRAQQVARELMEQNIRADEQHARDEHMIGLEKNKVHHSQLCYKYAHSCVSRAVLAGNMIAGFDDSP
jgi:hypothetical protein